MLISPFLHPSACNRVISICEEHGGWSNDERSAYPFATSDLEVPGWQPAFTPRVISNRTCAKRSESFLPNW